MYNPLMVSQDPIDQLRMRVESIKLMSQMVQALNAEGSYTPLSPEEQAELDAAKNHHRNSAQEEELYQPLYGSEKARRK